MWSIVWRSQADVGGIGTDNDILSTTITAPSYYVDQNTGCVNFCFGLSWQNAFDSLNSALSAAEAAGGGIIRIADGTYHPDTTGLVDPRDATFALPGCTRIMGGYAGVGATNPDLRDINAFPTVLSGEIGTAAADDNCYHVVTGDASTIESVLSGLTITRGYATDGMEAGGIYQVGGSLVIEQCEIADNGSVGRIDGLWLENVPKIFIRSSTFDSNGTAAYGGKIISSDKVYVSGVLQLDSTLQLYDTGIVNGEPLLPGAPGSINVGPTGRFFIDALDEGIVDPSQSSAAIDTITGSGIVQLSVGQGFVFSGTMDLRGSAPPNGGCDDPQVTAQWGELKVLGEMLLDGALIEHARISNFDDNETPEDCGNYVGGKLISLSASEIRDCAITVRGDRYFEFNPDEAQNALSDSCLTVDSVLPASFGEQGRLFEARSADVTLGDPNSFISGAYQIDGSDPGFDDVYAIDELRITQGARMSIINEEDYTQSAGPEVVYARNLVLEDDAVLNTGFNRIYYENLTLGNNASIVDVPLLGFSLGEIDFENECDFDLRVARSGDVARVATSDGYAMQLTAQSPFSSSAKGTFARAESSRVLVKFDYRFTFEPGGYLNVYLSDSRYLGSGNRVLIGTVGEPAFGRPGSLGSTEYAQFAGVFPDFHLNWTGGTYVELEFYSVLPNFFRPRVLIDDFDPAVVCTTVCADLTGDYGLSNRDVLYQLAEFGQNVGGANFCLDNQRTSSDYYGDVYDLYTSDGLNGQLADGSLNACGIDPNVSLDPPSVPSLPGNSWVISGKSNTPGDMDDSLFPVHSDGTPNGAPQPCASAPGPSGRTGNFRLIRGPGDALYQLNATQGLIRLSDATVVLAPVMLTFDDGQDALNCYIGPVPTGGGSFEGVPLLDAAFDPADPDAIFVGPVVVDSSGQDCPYQSVARINLVGPTVTNLYGEAPSQSSVFGYGCELVHEPDLDRIREIEVDSDDHLFVAVANAFGSNQWLRIWDVLSGNELQRIALDALPTPVEAATAMLVTADGETLFVGSSVNDAAATSTEVHRFSIDVNSSTPLTPSGTYILNGMKFVTALAERPMTGEIVAVGFYADEFNESEMYLDDSSIFSDPMLAVLPPTPGSVNATLIDTGGLALPLAVAFTPSQSSSCLRGDTNNDMTLDVGDVSSFVGFLLEPPQDPSDFCRTDVNEDGVVDGMDIAAWVDCIAAGGC